MKNPILFGGQTLGAAGQSFHIYEWQGAGPEYMHVHHADDEAWHVLEGSLEFSFLDKIVVAGPGSTMFVPAGVAHSYVERGGPCKYLVILTPRLAAMIDELHVTPLAHHGEVLLRYDSEILSP